MDKRFLELLAPAKDIETAKIAILAGADSVYIGAKNFGARAAAGNSTEDIAELCSFAHIYGCNVYVTINTILNDAQIQEARELIAELRGVGVDAIIAQDLGLLAKCNESVEFHASTQCHLTTPEKAQFLSDCGFETLVLARELSLEEIKKISDSVENRLECFVHGALCVSYSGQCYLSAAIGGRSGNRGVCAQPCRMKYSLVDANEKSIAKDAHFLSLRDMNRSGSLLEMIEAGVSVFKIEGRLKNADYVKNVTSYYRQKLDDIIKNNPEKYARSSFGKSSINFEPIPQKTFSRAFTEYHLHGISAGNESFSTPKARGEFLGRATKTFQGGFFFPDAKNIFSNGDGILAELENETFGGDVYKIENDKVYISSPSQKILLPKNANIWRNKDVNFEKLLSQKIERKREIKIQMRETTDAWSLIATTCDNQKISAEIEIEKQCYQISNNFEQAKNYLQKNLSKLGETPFAGDAKIDAQTLPHLKISEINALRRQLINALEKNILQKREQKLSNYLRRAPKIRQYAKQPFAPDKTANVTNKYALEFYKNLGFEITEPALDLQQNFKGEKVMTTRHCVLRELGLCKKDGGLKNFAEPLYLKNREATVRLKFDCAHCAMNIFFE